ncbi:MAG TPA: hypothetical protein VE818_04105 [Nitrososphaeraceae archaeon]|nr:hypothetical protein [Nitrososphaeraceae archaeon]
MCFDYEIPEKQKIKNRKPEEETMEVEPELEKEEERPLMASP